MPQPVLATTVVGSYPQPDWLVDRALLSKGVPRVRQRAIWRIPEPFLEAAQDDATIVAIRELERAGLDIITDGEIRRESYSNHFATALEGVDVTPPGVITDRYGNQTDVPRVVARVRRARPVEVRGLQFLRQNTDRPVKITLPGPFTMAQQARNEFYPDVEALAMDLAVAVNEEAREARSGGSGRDPARRAVATQRPGRGQALRGSGNRPGAPGPGRAHRDPPVLRLRGGRPPPEA
jgi:5-methyltetrahydropteroyltriglutamate--homocysteine methyltransferase